MSQDIHVLKVLDLAKQLLQIAQIPLHGSKHSQKTFTQHQLFQLLVLKSYEQKGYEKFEEYLKTATVVTEHLKLNRIPHYTTLQKFAQRQNIQQLEKLLLRFVDLAPKKPKELGTDATSIRSHYASEHYEKRIGRSEKKKDYFKANFVYDLVNQVIVAVKMRGKARGDLRDMMVLFKKTKAIPYRKFFADKAYDAEWFHEIIFLSGRTSWIHLKNESKPVHRTQGQYRKHMKRRQKNSQKGKRSLCESVNSALKRLFGAFLHARSLTAKKIEFLFKIITYNLDRIVKITKSLLQKIYLLFCFAVLLQKQEY